MNNSKKMNNKGFSLIELIVVIAIMVVLVAVLSPVFTRFIEEGRRATDVSNANTLAEAILIDFEAGEAKSTATKDAIAAVNKDDFPSIGSVPAVQATTYKGKSFYYLYDSTAHVVKITIDTFNYDLTDPEVADAYRTQATVSGKTAIKN